MTVLSNKSILRIDGADKVSGIAKFPADFQLKNQLYMKVLFTEKVHAIISFIDTSNAEKVPGVVAILTSKDVPNNEYGLGKMDQPVLCGPTQKKEFANRVRCVADKIALVIAESEEIAERARNLIQVRYEDLPIIDDVNIAFASDKNLVHPEIGSNVFCHYKIRKGNIVDPFKDAEVIVEDIYETPVQEHAYLQPEAGISYIDEKGKITVVVAGQWIHEDQEQIAHALNLDLEQIRVIYPAIGGAFGGREDMSVQIILALATLKLKEKGIVRPVKIVWSRQESIRGHHKRHAYKIYAKWGAKKNGKLVAAQVKLVADGGAYNSTSTKVLGNATIMCTGPYFFPNVIVDAYAVYTNNITGGAFRGFGGPQAAFAAESQMNRLASELEMDPVEFRLINTVKEGQNLSVNSPLPPGNSIDLVIKRCAIESGWTINNDGFYENPNQRNAIGQSKVRSTGFACGFKNIGFSFGAPENCWAIIELHGNSEIDYALLRHAGAEVGQGAHTAFMIMTARALNLPIEKIKLVMSDTRSSKNSGSVSASRMTFMAGNAIIGAAKQAVDNWNKEERPAIGEFKYVPPATTPLDPETGKSTPNFAYGYVAESVTSTIDTETGEIVVDDVCVVDDVGFAVNPGAVEGQIEGAISQALGYAITENFVQKNGQVLSDKFSTYLIPTVLDMPKVVRSIIVEHHDPLGPFGVRGMGEMPFIPFAPALTHSVFTSTGIWFNKIPLTPYRVLSRINDK